MIVAGDGEGIDLEQDLGLCPGDPDTSIAARREQDAAQECRIGLGDDAGLDLPLEIHRTARAREAETYEAAVGTDRRGTVGGDRREDDPEDRAVRVHGREVDLLGGSRTPDALDLERLAFRNAEQEVREVRRHAEEPAVLGDVEDDDRLTTVLRDDLRAFVHCALDELAEALLRRLHLPAHDLQSRLSRQITPAGSLRA